MLKNLPKFTCKKCKKIVPYRIEDGIAECDTPIGTVRQVYFRAYCEECGEELNSCDLKSYNYFAMVVGTVGFLEKEASRWDKKTVS